MKKIFTSIVLLSIGAGIYQAQAANNNLTTRAEDWQLLGTGFYRECMVSAIMTSVPQQEVPVEIYWTQGENGIVYKLENVYANWEAPSDEFMYDNSGEYDMFIHVFKVNDSFYYWIEEFHTGIFIEDMGEMILTSQVGKTAQENPGKEEDLMKTYQDCFGLLNDHVMTYPTNMISKENGTTQRFTNLLTGFSLIPDQKAAANTSDAPFVITLPDVDLPSDNAAVEDIYNDADENVRYFNLQGIEVTTPEAGRLLIKKEGKKVNKVMIR